DGIRIALCHSDVGRMEDGLCELGVGRDPILRALAADVLTFHRRRPPPEIDRLLEHDDPFVRTRGFAAAGRPGSILTAGLVSAARTDADAAARRTALDAAARHGLGELPALCREAARRFEPVVEALAFLGVVGEHDDVATLEASLRDPALVAATLEGLADLGTPEVVPS